MAILAAGGGAAVAAFMAEMRQAFTIGGLGMFAGVGLAAINLRPAVPRPAQRLV